MIMSMETSEPIRARDRFMYESRRIGDGPLEFVSASTKWLQFSPASQTKKTYVIEVTSRMTDAVLGEIKWYPPYRAYAFYTEYIVLDVVCMNAVVTFIKRLTEEHNLNLKWRKKQLAVK